ncbi:MAG: PAS domain-containing protein, partial [Limisphaerales bacterium]
MSHPIAKGIARIVLPYVLFASLWILLSDWLLEALVADPVARTPWSIYKGWAFVLVTALLLAGLLRVDLAARERHQAALRESEGRWHALFEQAPQGILLTDVAGRNLEANPAACRMLGYPREELLRLNLAELLAPEERPRLAPQLDRLLGGEAVFSAWTFRRKDASRFPGEISARRVP